MKNFIVFVLFTACVIAQSVRPKLHVDENGAFKITQFTDLHYGDGDHDDETTQIMRTILKTENPDFVAFTGDMVAGYGWDKQPGWYEKKWNAFTSILNETRIPYGYTLGNHDSEADKNRREIMEIDEQNPWSYSQEGPKDVVGASNFMVPVYAYKNDTKIVLTLWFLDSGDYNCMGQAGYGCIDPTAIEWYMKKSTEIEKEQGYPVPGLAFFHIPVPEYLIAWSHFNGVGGRYEDCGCASLNTGLLAAALKRKDLKATFVGHDHEIDFNIDYYGIHLIHGRKTGVGCYGPSEGVKRGGRVIVAKTTGTNEMSLDTWITNEDAEREYQTERTGKVDEKQDICKNAKTPRVDEL
ncbi:hypothetical protein WA158_004819 [Blastocystis sp. Blastoise]